MILFKDGKMQATQMGLVSKSQLAKVIKAALRGASLLRDRSIFVGAFASKYSMETQRFSGAAIFAVLASLASVVISVIGNRTQERLLAASVWPYVAFASGNTSDDGQKRVIAFSLTNEGSGPALIKDFSLELDHQKVVSGMGLLERCCGLPKASVLTATIVGRVLRPGDSITYLQWPYSDKIADGWNAFDNARFGRP